ncbi:hypothetical protein [Ideonella sp. A 288]|uniref:hypothetical protein n=1 Tax=Ideonella sp. A 288 TaxID=1962181 RepID=UPI000B4C0E83|nr:hypothetical protein [Ideonella sp. A 288]
MTFSPIGVVLCLAAALTSFSSHAGDHRKESRVDRDGKSVLQAITVRAKAGEPGHGWQFFSDAPRRRAVVISPNGHYYYSHGEGLELVFKASTAA